LPYLIVLLIWFSGSGFPVLNGKPFLSLGVFVSPCCVLLNVVAGDWLGRHLG